MVEEKMLMTKCLCGGFLYQHTDLETANQYIYCPKCKEEADKVKERLADEQVRGFLAITKMLGITDSQVDEMKEKFDIDYKRKILTDIRDYLVAILDEWHRRSDEPNFYEQNIGVYNHIRKELDDLTEYAKKLGVEL